MQTLREVARVLPEQPFARLDDYLGAGGGRGLEAAARLGPATTIEEVEAAGLRGRGGAGFPTGVKWRAVAVHGSESVPATVAVNAAEGEPGTFKDRVILRRNPYAVLEGALIAASAVGADRVVVVLKQAFREESARLSDARDEIVAAGWCRDVNVGVTSGPGEYLLGEETALLEVLAGRPPFPRIAPPFRQGIDEVGSRPDQPGGTVMAQPGASGAPPTLVNNVETLANVAGILAEGPEWFRSVGTVDSPGTVVCTVTGATRRHGVAEVALGTPLATVIDAVGEGPRPGRRFVGAVSGVANALLPADRFETPLTYEAMREAGSGLGAAGFILLDDATDLAAVAAGISRYLAVESCGQCTPCKSDGLAIADHLERICRGAGDEVDLDGVVDRVATVADEARCYLAAQHQMVIESFLRLFPDTFHRHVAGAEAVGVELIAPVVDIVDGQALLDERWRAKRPDWTYEGDDPTQTPVERLAEGGPERPS